MLKIGEVFLQVEPEEKKLDTPASHYFADFLVAKGL